MAQLDRHNRQAQNNTVHPTVKAASYYSLAFVLTLKARNLSKNNNNKKKLIKLSFQSSESSPFLDLWEHKTVQSSLLENLKFIGDT